MSFRIDDILKKDEKVSSSSKREKSQKCTTSSSPNLHNFKTDVVWKNLSPPSQCSNNILQQTLQNKLHVPPHLPYYLPLAECPTTTTTTTKFCSNLYNYDVILPLQTLNSYVDRGCSSLYSRTRFWPPHAPCPAFFPLSYPHYSKRKGGQVRFTTSQTEALEKRFGAHKYLSPEDRRILANSLKLSDRQVKTWFQNRRAKWRRCNSSVSSNSSETINKGVSNYESDNELDEVNHSRSASLPSMLLKAGEHSTQ